MDRLEDRFFTEKDLMRYIKDRGPIDENNVGKLWTWIVGYYVYNCTTWNGSCGEAWIFPIKNSNEVLQER